MLKLKFGISTSSFFNRINTESTFDIVRKMHIDTVELALTTFSEYERRFVEALIPRKGSLDVFSIKPEGGQFEPELFSTNARIRADAEVFFKKVCTAGQMLGARHYVFLGPVRLKKHKYEFDFVRLGDRINQLNEIARSMDLQLTYQNAFYSYGSNPDYFKELSKQCPHLTYAISFRHALMAGIDPIRFIDAVGEKAVIIQMCDVKKDLNSVLPGEGKYNFDKFFSEAKKRGVNAYMFLEAISRDYRDLTQLKTSYDFLNALWHKSRT